ncbi:MAG: hypothetical protein KatS3mg131_1809 [Candidatus Tectimicrobiota bacterium]|nr:MAG: hypothetical protein KatS3mg131_1809 [Candidatus Tectomicrobia bacterium]
MEALETEDLDLDRSLQYFEEGVHLSRYCNQQLQAAEKRIDMLLSRADGSFEVQPFVLRDESPGSNGDDVPPA